MIEVNVEEGKVQDTPEINYGDLFYWTNYNKPVGICMITYRGSVSLETPDSTWEWEDALQIAKDNLEQGYIVLAPKNTKVIITQK